MRDKLHPDRFMRLSLFPSRFRQQVRLDHYCGAAGAAGEALAPDPPLEAPNAPEDVPSMTSAFSGFMLSMSFSTGMVAGGGVGVVPAGFASGVFMGMPELDGRKAAGYFGRGKGAPTGMGATISGVTITMSSVFVLFFEIDWKNLPRIGIFPRNGIF